MANITWAKRWGCVFFAVKSGQRFIKYLVKLLCTNWNLFSGSRDVCQFLWRHVAGNLHPGTRNACSQTIYTSVPFASGFALRALKGKGREGGLKGGRKWLRLSYKEKKKTNAHTHTRVTASLLTAELFPLQLLWPERGRIWASVGRLTGLPVHPDFRPHVGGPFARFCP